MKKKGIVISSLFNHWHWD